MAAHVFEPVFSREDLIEICKKANFGEARKSGLNMARYRKAFSEQLSGMNFTCKFNNGISLPFRFRDVHTLEWSEDGSAWYEEYYEALQSSAGNVIGMLFTRRHTLPYEGAFMVFDMDSGFATWARIVLGSAFDEKFAAPTFYFGEMEGVGSHEGMRPHFSTGLMGTSIDWQYNEEFSIRHSYVSPVLTISPHMPKEKLNEDGEDERFIGRLFLRARNAKIRDDLYLTSFTEPGNCCAVLLIDLKLVHDIGCFYGITYQGELHGETITAMGGIGSDGLKPDVGYARPKAEF